MIRVVDQRFDVNYILAFVDYSVSNVNRLEGWDRVRSYSLKVYSYYPKVTFLFTILTSIQLSWYLLSSSGYINIKPTFVSNFRNKHTKNLFLTKSNGKCVQNLKDKDGN